MMQSTYDKELSFEILTQIFDAIQKIKKRFRPISSPEDFTNIDTLSNTIKKIMTEL